VRRLAQLWKRSQQNCLAGFQRVTRRLRWCFLAGEKESIEIVRRTGVPTFPPWAARLHYPDDDSYAPTAHMLILFSYLRRMFKKIRIQMIDEGAFRYGKEKGGGLIGPPQSRWGIGPMSAFR
jgi:hypothetical protein